MSDVVFTHDVFLSHSSKDKAVVRGVAERLRADGLRVWFDEWVLKAGDSIPAKIEEGLERSRVLVLCMSTQAFGSDWAQLEAGTFRFRDPLNSSPLLFKRLKEEIVRLKDAGRVLMRFNELRQTLQLRLSGENARFTDEELRAVVSLLAGPGVVWS